MPRRQTSESKKSHERSKIKKFLAKSVVEIPPVEDENDQELVEYTVAAQVNEDIPNELKKLKIQQENTAQLLEAKKKKAQERKQGAEERKVQKAKELAERREARNKEIDAMVEARLAKLEADMNAKLKLLVAAASKRDEQILSAVKKDGRGTLTF